MVTGRQRAERIEVRGHAARLTEHVSWPPIPGTGVGAFIDRSRPRSDLWTW
jgi:hypothetical protein